MADTHSHNTPAADGTRIEHGLTELAEKALEADLGLGGQTGSSDGETTVGDKGTVSQSPTSLDWDADAENPYNWPASKKAWQVTMTAAFAFVTSVGTSIVAAAHGQLMGEFGVTSTQAILPLSLYVFALGLGPVVGGPLSETIGRYFIFVVGGPLGALFTLGAGLTHSFAALCILRFLAGFCLAPSLAIASGTINETYKPVDRGLPSTFFILTPFLGPGIAPVIGAFVVERKGWRWTQWTMIFFLIISMAIALLFGRETYHPVLKRRRAKQLGRAMPPPPSFGATARLFLTIGLLRPIRMLFTEPIVGLVCLYVACEFGTLFSFFAAVPYVFQSVYGFSIEETGLIFLSIVVGCLLGAATVIACDIFLYRRQIPKHPPHMIPPEHRLYPAMIGSVGLPLGLFWFAWTARLGISWASPTVAIVPFAWGNMCLFISTMQYIADVYHGTTVASAASANSLARYGLAGAFPLFTIQMYSRLGIDWASSLFAFVALALLPVPWMFFKYGKKIRALSRYETASY